MIKEACTLVIDYKLLFLQGEMKYEQVFKWFPVRIQFYNILLTFNTSNKI